MELTRRPGPSARVRVREYADAAAHEREDRLAVEEPLEVRMSWAGRAQRVAVTMRTPGHDFELAAGLLVAEGLVDPRSIGSVSYCLDPSLGAEQEYNVVTVTLSDAPLRDPRTRYDGPAASTSACGVCGTESIDDVLTLLHTSERMAVDGTGRELVPVDALVTLPERLRAAQPVFDRTGGLHAAGLFDADGTLLVSREDIGRHNAVDKVVGARVLAREPTAAPVLCVSGRVGFEIVQKAVAAGVHLLAAIGAPSSLAVRLAERAGLGVVGFLGRDRFVCYSAPDRIAW